VWRCSSEAGTRTDPRCKSSEWNRKGESRLTLSLSYHAEPSGTFYRYDAKAIGSGSEGAQAELVNEYHKYVVPLAASIHQHY
jgi:hypothetical protein